MINIVFAQYNLINYWLKYCHYLDRINNIHNFYLIEKYTVE